ncbi:MAG: DMT family transporter, partial [Alphaproteobacteria bacterium]
ASALVIYAVGRISLADATAILFVAPLVMTILSVPLLGEHVGIHRWTAVIIGFVGVLVIARPGYGGFGVDGGILVAAACCSALYQMLTRSLRSTETSQTMIFYTAFIGTMISTMVLPFSWVWPNLQGWGLLVFSGLIYGLGQFLLVRAFSNAEASLLAPFLYAQIIGATVFGYFVFSNFPDTQSIIGAAIIVAAGLYVAWREHLAERRQRQVSNAETP